MSTAMFNGFESLIEHGVCVFPLPNKSPQVLQQEFDESLLTQSELLIDGKLMSPPYVGGGFAAFGHASSFHNDFVRDIRIIAHQALHRAILEQKVHIPAELQGGKIELLPCRQTFRPAGITPSPESWHRDLSPTELTSSNSFVKALPGDLILGGWVNCNAMEAQSFVCIPGSHISESLGSGGKNGFKSLTKEEMALCKQQQITVEIPPAHGMFFIQDTIHCVNAKKLSFDMRRVHISARITHSTTTEPLIVDIEHRLRTGAVLPLKSGQIPPMYPKLWEVNWQDKLIALSEKFAQSDAAMTEKRFVGGKRLRDRDDTPDEGIYPILKKIAPSVPPPTPYSDEEIALYLPHNLS